METILTVPTPFGWRLGELLCLLLLSRFSRVRLCATPLTTAHQAPPSLGFSRQEHWSGLPFPSPVLERESESEVAQSCLTLCDPVDCSPPGSSVHGFSRQEYWSRVPLPSPHCVLGTVKGILCLLFSSLSNSADLVSKKIPLFRY